MDERRKEGLIADRIAGLLNTYFELKCDFIPSMYDKQLTGQPFELSGFDLYQLLMLVEEEYGIYVRPDDVRQHGFSTINDVIHMVLLYT